MWGRHNLTRLHGIFHFCERSKGPNLLNSTTFPLFPRHIRVCSGVIHQYDVQTKHEYLTTNYKDLLGKKCRHVHNSIHSGKLRWQWKTNHLKMYLLLKLVIFCCHVSVQGGISRKSCPSFFSLRSLRKFHQMWSLRKKAFNRGHYITNPIIALWKRNLSNLPYICSASFPPKWVIQWPLFKAGNISVRPVVGRCGVPVDSQEICCEDDCTRT